MSLFPESHYEDDAVGYGPEDDVVGYGPEDDVVGYGPEDTVENCCSAAA